MSQTDGKVECLQAQIKPKKLNKNIEKGLCERQKSRHLTAAFCLKLIALKKPRMARVAAEGVAQLLYAMELLLNFEKNTLVCFLE